MPNITITNKKTFGRKIQKTIFTLVAAGIIGAGVYFYKDIEQKGEETIAKWQIENIINNNDYVGARKKLEELKDNISSEQTSELEKKIESIHPDSLFAKIDQNKLKDYEDEFKREKDLLKNITDGYKFLGKKVIRTDYKYLQTLLTYASSKLRESYEGRNEEEVVKTLKDIKKDGVLEKIPHNGTAIIDKNTFYYFRESVKNYIESFDDKTFYYGEIATAIDLGIHITEKTDSTQKRQIVNNLINAYAKITKRKMYDSENYQEDKVKSLWLLKNFEKKYNYKNSFMNTEKEMSNLIWKL